MHYVRFIVFAAILSIAGCQGELDANDPAVEADTPNWELTMTAETSSTTSVTIQENTPGFCGVDGNVDDNNAGYTGSGFANTNDASGNGVDWSVNVPISGRYQLGWRFANGASSLPGDLLVDSVSMDTVEFPSTGSWTSWGLVSTTINLTAGWHSLSLVATSSGGLANIDWLTVIGDSPQTGDCNGSSSDPPVSFKFETELTAVLLDVSGPTPIPVTLQLNSGDSLRATDGVQAIDLEPLENEDRVYTGTFPMEVVGQDLTVSLIKTTPPLDVDWWVPTGDSPEPDFSDFFIDAPNTQVHLPVFTIDAPTYISNPDPPDDFREEFPLGTDVTIAWTPNGTEASMRLIFGATCINVEDLLGPPVQGPVGVVELEGDSGSFTTEVDNFLAGHSDVAKQLEEGCVVRLTLERTTDEGNLTPDPALSADSNLVAQFRRFIEIKTVPSP